MSSALPPTADAPPATVSPGSLPPATPNTADVKQAVVEKDVKVKPIKDVAKDIAKQGEKKAKKPKAGNGAGGKEVSRGLSLCDPSGRLPLARTLLLFPSESSQKEERCIPAWRSVDER